MDHSILMEKAGREYKDDAVDMSNRAKDTTLEKAKEMKILEKVGECKDYAAEKAKETEELAGEKAVEFKDYTVEKVMEGKDTSSVGKMSELKDTAAGVARRAMDFWTGKKQEMIETEKMTDEIKEKYTSTEDEARKKMHELKLKEEGREDEDKKRAAADRETAADRGIAGRSNIYSVMWSTRDIFRDKMSMPTDMVNESRAAGELGGTKRIAGAKKVDGDEGVKLVSVDHDIPAGATSTHSKEVD